MRRMTESEFYERNQAVMMAKRIYIPHVTKNLTTAFEIYKAVFNEHEHETFIDRMTTRRTPIDGYQRPKCPKCDMWLSLIIITLPKGKANKNGYRTLWQCPVCAYENYSTKTVTDWLRELKPELNTKKERNAYPWGCMKTIE